MISVIIPTLNSARVLPRALSPLVEGVAHGVLKQVLVSDGGSHDETLEIADAAGCDIVAVEGDRTARMRAAATKAKGAWLLFLPPETALAPGWASEAARFMAHPSAAQRAGAFKLVFDGDAGAGALAWARFRSRWLKLPGAEQGLLIPHALCDALDGYADNIATRLGRRRLVSLESEAVVQRAALRRSSGV